MEKYLGSNELKTACSPATKRNAPDMHRIVLTTEDIFSKSNLLLGSFSIIFFTLGFYNRYSIFTNLRIKYLKLY